MADKALKSKFAKKAIVYTLIILLLFFAFYNRQVLVDQLENVPIAFTLYKHTVQQIEERTFLGLFYANFFGGLFFVFLPVEIIYLYYSLLDYSDLFIFLISMAGIMFAMAANYLVGLILGNTILKFVLRNKYEWLKRINDRWGGLIIVIGNAILFPSQLYALVVGATRYPFKRYMLYTAFGRTIKYVLLIVGKDYFLEVIVPWMHAFM